jgi:ribulose-bisphosphate carboxylase large chain
VNLGGERFSVVYRLAGSRAEAEGRARELCIEQTVEFPSDLLSRFDPAIASDVVGRLESLRPLRSGRGFEATVSYAVETVGPEEDPPLPARRRLAPELTQLLNVLFGNTSIKRGVRVERLELSEAVLAGFRGPRFGRRGLRRLLGVEDRALLCSALKPMGLSARELARMAEALALGGVDLIKDDHGLADQPFCRFEERVSRCAEAVARANARTGGRTLYLPNVTAPADRLRARARFAREAGAGGLLVAPALVGPDAVRLLADDDSVGLPVMAHPALLGSYLIRADQGFSCRALLGQLMRLCGADAVIFPHHGGRFPLTPEDCRGLCEGAASPMGTLRPIFPVPAGGISLPRVPELCAFYGDDVILLIGGDLHRGPDLVESCRELREQVEKHRGTAAPAAGESVECVVCGAELCYLEHPRTEACVYCGRAESTQTVCGAGHFVCDGCHARGALEALEHICAASEERDMIALLKRVRAHPSFHVHGPEHHALVPAVMVATYRNLGGEIPEGALRTAVKWGSRVPGGMCGFAGTCGGATGVGIGFSAILGVNPRDAVGRQKVMRAAAVALADIASHEAARCCQRDCWLALRSAAETSRELLPIPLVADEPLACAQSHANKECLKERCPLFTPAAVSVSAGSPGTRAAAWAGGPAPGRAPGRRPRRRSGGGAPRAGGGRWSPGRRRRGGRPRGTACGPRSGRSCSRCTSAPGFRRARARARGGRASPRRGSSGGRSGRR